MEIVHMIIVLCTVTDWDKVKLRIAGISPHPNDLFGVQLGGGTDINRALTYCQQTIQRPSDTVLILITDLYEGGDNAEMRKRAKTLTEAGVQVIVLLALND